MNIKPLLITLSLSNSLNLSVNLSCNLSVPKYVYCNLSFSHLFLYIYLFTVSLSFSYFFSLFQTLRPSHLFSLSIPLPSLCPPPLSLIHMHTYKYICIYTSVIIPHICFLFHMYSGNISHRQLTQITTISYDISQNHTLAYIYCIHLC